MRFSPFITVPLVRTLAAASLLTPLFAQHLEHLAHGARAALPENLKDLEFAVCRSFACFASHVESPGGPIDVGSH